MTLVSDDEGLEPPRSEPGFRVWVVHTVQKDHPPIDVTEAVMDVYGIAVNSMEFGTGLLTTAEVGTLRALGEAIGAERFDYQHDSCLRCGHDLGWVWAASGHQGTPERACGEYCCSCPEFIRPEGTVL